MKYLSYEKYKTALVEKSSACEGKIPFPSPVEARSALPKRNKHIRVYVFRCGFCHKYHIGSNAKPRSDRGRPKSKNLEVELDDDV